MARATRGGYVLSFNLDEMQALAYIAHRYESGRVLYDHLELVRGEDEITFAHGQRVEWRLSEPGAWAYMDALQEEGGVVPPLAGGHLASELIDLYNKVV